MGDDPDAAKCAAWYRKAQFERWTCDRCGNTPEYDERDEFFESGLCGWFANQGLRD